MTGNYLRCDSSIIFIFTSYTCLSSDRGCSIVDFSLGGKTRRVDDISLALKRQTRASVRAISTAYLSVKRDVSLELFWKFLEPSWTTLWEWVRIFRLRFWRLCGNGKETVCVCRSDVAKKRWKKDEVNTLPRSMNNLRSLEFWINSPGALGFQNTAT